MLSRLKNVAANVWDYAKAVYLTNSALVQIVGGAGSTLYVIPKISAHFTGSEIFPYQTIATSVLVTGTVVTLVYCRSESIFYRFSDQYKAEESIQVKTKTGKAIVYAATGVAIANSLTGGLSFYLYAATFVEQIVSIAQHRPQNKELSKEIHSLATVQGLSASFYLNKVISNFAFTVKRVHDNVSYVVKHFEDGHSIMDVDKRALAIALSGTVVGLIPLPMSSYYWTGNTLTSLPYITLSESTNHIIAGTSASLSASVYLLTGPFSLYHFAKKEKRQTTRSSTCMSINTAIAYTAITIDWVGASMNNFAGIVGSSEKMIGVEGHNIYLRIVAGASSGTASGLNAMLNREGYLSSAAHVSDRLSNAEQYTAVPQGPEDHPASGSSSPQIEYLDDDAPDSATAPRDIEAANVSTNKNAMFTSRSTTNSERKIIPSRAGGPKQSMSAPTTML